MNPNHISLRDFQRHLEQSIKFNNRYLADIKMMGDKAYDKDVTPNQYFEKLSNLTEVNQKYNNQQAIEAEHRWRQEMYQA